MLRLLLVIASVFTTCTYCVNYSTTSASPDTILYRLRGSFFPWEGRLEVRYKNQWGTVCDDAFNNTAAAVACRSLGYYGGEFVGTRFGAGSYGTTIWLDDVVCTGSERSIDQCSHRGWNNQDCTHNEDASIVCRETEEAVTQPPLNSSVRLLGGTSEREGRLLVYYNNTWNSVCYSYFTTPAARVVCASLGFGRVGLYTMSPYDMYTSYGQIWPFTVQCNGNESSIFECNSIRTMYFYCSHYEDVYISCIPTIRLVGGQRPTEGRLEVYRSGAWGTVCGHLFDDVAASVACKDLGLGSVGHTLHTRYGPGTGQILMDDIVCRGYEVTLTSCSYSSWISSYHCNHSSDVSIACYNRPLNATDILRLAGSDQEREGRLEIFHNGLWGTVCDVNFNVINARVACNSLGFGYVGQVLQNHYGAGSGHIWLSNVTCNGAEKSLAACSHAAWGVTYGYISSRYYYCYHNNDVSISCYNTNSSRGNETTVRLVNGPSTREGRLEIKHSGVWGTVCDDSFDDADARVACFSLGFGYYGITLNNRYGPGSGTIWLDDLACVGYETSLEQCPHNGWGSHNCGHSEDVSISCGINNSTDNLAYRLVNGPSPDSGRLEVYHSGLWGTVCDDGFNDVDASVACISLGFNGTGRTLGNLYGPGTGRIWLDDVSCSGQETSLGDCRHGGWGVHNCGHSEDVSISCRNYTGLGIRLVGSTNEMTGRLEILHSDRWGTVCNDAFDDVDAAVACFSLGFGRAGVTLHRRYGGGTFSQPIWLDGVQCIGNESSLGDCRHNGWGTIDCDHGQDVSIQCTATSQPTPRAHTTTTTTTTTTTKTTTTSSLNLITTTATSRPKSTARTTTTTSLNLNVTTGPPNLQEGSGKSSPPTVAIVLGVVATVALLVAAVLLLKYLKTRRENELLRNPSYAVFRSNSESSDGMLHLEASEDDDVACLLTP